MTHNTGLNHTELEKSIKRAKIRNRNAVKPIEDWGGSYLSIQEYN